MGPTALLSPSRAYWSECRCDEEGEGGGAIRTMMTISPQTSELGFISMY